MPYGRVNEGDVLYFINNDAEGLVRAKATVTVAFHSEKLSEDEARILVQQNQPKLCLTQKQFARWIGKRYMVLIEVADISPVSPFTIDNSKYGNMDDWLAVECIESVWK